MTGREFLLAVGQLYDVPFGRLSDHVDRLVGVVRSDEGKRLADSQLFQWADEEDRGLLGGSPDAPVLLLDEPFSGGMDPSGILALRRVLKRMASQEQATVIVTSPVPELVEELADRIAVLSDGRILAYDTVDGLRRQTGCTGSLAEALERLLHPGTGQGGPVPRRDEAMIGRILLWNRLVLPPWWVVVGSCSSIRVIESLFSCLYVGWSLDLPGDAKPLVQLWLDSQGDLKEFVSGGCFLGPAPWSLRSFASAFIRRTGRNTAYGCQCTPWTVAKPLPWRRFT